MRRRILLSVAAGAVVVAVFAGGWFLATTFESPAQRAAHASAPAAGVVTAEVTRGSLSEASSFSVKIQFEDVRDKSVVVGAEGTAVVTRRPAKPGMSVGAGSVVSEVNGRPVFVLPGKFAFYRDLVKGDKGPDVTQLQKGLKAAGIGVAVTGKVDGATLRALARMYSSAGYSAPKAAAGDNTDSGDSDGTSTQALSVKRATGPKVMVSQSELMVIRSLPVTLTETPKVGHAVKGSLKISYGSGAIVAKGMVESDSVGGISEGQRATLSDGAKSWKATVSRVGKLSGNKTVPVTLRADSTSWPRRPDASGAIVTITTHTGPENAMLVPTAAVDTGAGSASYVLKQTSQGHYLRVPVTELGSLAGKTAVSAPSGKLQTGDLVKVG